MKAELASMLLQGGAQAMEIGLESYASEREFQVAANNARFAQAAAEQEAEFARAAGSIKEQRVRRKNRRARAANRLRVAKSGVRADIGSPLEFAARNAAEFEREALAVRTSADLAVRSARNRATQARDRKRSLLSQQRLNRASQALGGFTQGLEFDLERPR